MFKGRRRSDKKPIDVQSLTAAALADFHSFRNGKGRQWNLTSGHRSSSDACFCRCPLEWTEGAEERGF